MPLFHQQKQTVFDIKVTNSLRVALVSFYLAVLTCSRVNKCILFIFFPPFRFPSLCSYLPSDAYLCSSAASVGLSRGFMEGEPCQLKVNTVPGSVYQAGDVVIGGLFIGRQRPEFDF